MLVDPNIDDPQRGQPLHVQLELLDRRHNRDVLGSVVEVRLGVLDIENRQFAVREVDHFTHMQVRAFLALAALELLEPCIGVLLDPGFNQVLRPLDGSSAYTSLVCGDELHMKMCVVDRGNVKRRDRK